ncbi:cyclase family protein [Actinokineospora sp. NBRC 105648]|uniref:cyclase family protein n=1 Tax=Actinokineospora sp. NBRC 105648 TaxID=3032206 RepID=UPI0024A57E2A|nr:cyclase family protein [Actinokineospora sp. NBRC 105648]GLZ36610.1 cyclase [Actinokineospora sp. NBRC 105648]
MRIIDLPTPIDASVWEPNPVKHEVVSPAEGGRHMAEGMRERYGLEFDPAELPDGELLSLDTVKLTTHTGTHVDAPSHYGSRAAYGEPQHIDRMPLDWFVRPGMVLDLTDQPVGAAGADVLRREFDRVGRESEPMEIVMLNTGADRIAGTPAYFAKFVGLDAATNLLLDLGVRVIGTDAFSLDAPFTHMIDEFQRAGDRCVLWPAHFVGREREYCQIERLANLDLLPGRTGFTVSCLPVKLVNGGAGWARAVAFVPDE